MDYATQQTRLSDDVQGAQGGQTGWTNGETQAAGNAARLDQLGMLDGVDPTGGAGEAPGAIVAAVDRYLPPGLGVTLGAQEEFVCGPSGEAALGATILNAGGGWLDLDATVLLGGGLPGMIGGELGDTGGELEAGGKARVKAERKFHVPYTRLGEAAVLAGVLGSVLVPEGLEVVLHYLFTALRGVDLNPFVVGESYTGEGEVFGEIGVGVFGEELEAMCHGVASVTTEVAWKGLPDPSGHREGELSFTGSVEALQQVTVNLTKSFGVDAAPELGGAASATLVVPVAEDQGTHTYGTPFVRVQVAGEALSPSGSVTAELGPDPAAVAFSVGLSVGETPFSVLWRRMYGAIELVTGGLCEVNQESSMKASFSLELPPELVAAVPEAAAAVTRYLTTGVAGPELATFRSSLDAALDAAKVQVGVSLSLTVEGKAGAEVGDGLKVGGEGSVEGGVVFQRDDVSDLLTASPTPADVLSWLRGGGPAVA